MAFAATTTHFDGTNSLRHIIGQYTQASGDTGGDISTGLTKVYYADGTGATDVSISGGTVTITTADPGAAQTGYWHAYGI